MNILIIGGSGFLGPPLVERLLRQGHGVGVLHRGNAPTPAGAEPILGDRKNLAALDAEFRRFAPEVVIDLILGSGAQAEALMRAFGGLTRRVVAASSIDVYRACGILWGSEEGPLEPVPLTEDSALRTNQQTYPPEQAKRLMEVFGWLDENYDKIPVERAILSDPALPGTVLRLPMIYGPGDHLHRFFPVLKRIDDGRRSILFDERMAAWRAPRGYVENVAAAIALAAVDDRATGRIYNVAETPAFSELEWAQKIAAACGWQGQFHTLPKDRTPLHLQPPGKADQHWTADSSRIRRELGYAEPVPLEEAIRRTIAWERANPPAKFFDPRQFDYTAEDAATVLSP